MSSNYDTVAECEKQEQHYHVLLYKSAWQYIKCVKVEWYERIGVAQNDFVAIGPNWQIIRERERETERQTDRQTETERDREREREANRQTNRQTDRRQTDRPAR